jgi:hypothetical protein
MEWLGIVLLTFPLLIAAYLFYAYSGRAAVAFGALFIIGYLIFAYAYKPWSLSSTVLEQGPLPLNVQKIYAFNPAAFDMNSFTFTFYLYPQTGNRTANGGGDIRTNYSIFELTDCFSLQLLPAGANGQTGTQLQVKTLGQGDKSIETIPLPAMPFQKWSYVGISFEGRRVDVSYNGRIVSSTVLENMPQSNANGRLQSGSERVLGTMAFVSFAPYRQTAEQLMIDYVSSSNTRGEPYIGTQLPTIGNLFSCPAGLFCFKPKQPPNVAGAAWYTPFA